MKRKTKKQQVLELLLTGEPVRSTRLWALDCNSGYHYCLKQLRKEGYDIRCTYKIDDSFYQLMGVQDNGSNTNFATELQTA